MTPVWRIFRYYSHRARFVFVALQPLLYFWQAMGGGGY